MTVPSSTHCRTRPFMGISPFQNVIGSKAPRPPIEQARRLLVTGCSRTCGNRTGSCFPGIGMRSSDIRKNRNCTRNSRNSWIPRHSSSLSCFSQWTCSFSLFFFCASCAFIGADGYPSETLQSPGICYHRGLRKRSNGARDRLAS